MADHEPRPNVANVPIIHKVEDIPEATDLVVVLGKNVGQDWTPERVLRVPDLLSVDSEINALAAGLVWVPGRKILFSGGQKLGEDLPYQAESATRYFRRKYPYIPEEDILPPETTGYSTPKSAEALDKIIAKDHYGHVALLSVGYHLEYAPISFAQFGVHVESAIASEDILSERSTQFAEYIVAWRGLDRIRREREYSEKKLGEVLTEDFRGQKSDARTRQRVHDNK